MLVSSRLDPIGCFFGVCRFAVSSRVVSKACLVTYVQVYVSAVS